MRLLLAVLAFSACCPHKEPTMANYKITEICYRVASRYPRGPGPYQSGGIFRACMHDAPAR